MKKHLLKTLFLCLFAFAGTTASAYDCYVDGIYYDLNTAVQTASVTYGDDWYSGIVHIPAEVEYEGVAYAVTTISDEAFCFSDELTEVTIPNSVISIGNSAFSDCYGLAAVSIGNGITTIGDYAFYKCSSLTELTIPNSVTSIGDYALGYCNGLTELIIPSNVTIIGIHFFAGCYNLEKIIVEADNPCYDSRENCNAIIRTAENVLVAGCKNTRIPNSVAAIGDDAFLGCSYLTELSIPNSVISIGSWAFQNCTRLTELIIPSSVTSIGYNPLSGCYNLERIVVEESNPYYDSRENCNAIIHTAENALVGGCKHTHIPNSIAAIRDYAFSNCYYLTELTIPNSVTDIGNNAFLVCSGLERIVVEADNPYYDSREDCNAIIRTGENEVTLVVGCKNTRIPNSVTTIGNYAFAYCSGLTELTIPKGITTIGNYAFAYCSRLTELTIPNSVTTIGNYAFAYCSGLTELTIPNSVTSIGSSAFSGCSMIVSVSSLNTIPPIVKGVVFDYVVRQNATLHVPAGCKEAYAQAEGWKDFRNIQEDAVDGIAPVVAGQQPTTDAIYTIDGVKLNTTSLQDLPSGIYIVNGKKVSVKKP